MMQSQYDRKKFTTAGFAAICFASVAQMADLAVIPAADAIFEVYSDASDALLNFILSGPQLMIVLSAVLSTVLMQRYKKRPLLIGSFLLLTLASCLGGLIDDPVYVAFMRGAVGFFGGFCAPVSLAWIGEVCYDDEEKNSALVGIFSSVSSGFGLVFSLAAGMLCLTGWRNIFKTYWVFVPMFLFMIFFLPKENFGKTASDEIRTGKASADEKIPGAEYARVLVFAFFTAMIVNVIVYLCAVFVSERGIGDSSFAGIVSAVVTLFTAVICAMFGSVYKRLKKQTETLMLLLSAAAFIVMYFAHGKMLVLISAAMIGCAYGILVSYYYVDAATFVPESSVSKAVPYITAVIGLGSFASSYFTSVMMRIFKTELLGNIFPVLAVCMSVLGAIILFRSIKKQ